MKAHNEDHASENGSFSNVAMNGSEVFKFAVRAVPAVSYALPGQNLEADIKQSLATSAWLYT